MGMKNTAVASVKQLTLLDYNPDIAVLALTKGQVALISPIDEKWANQWKWHAWRIKTTSAERYYVRRCQWVNKVLRTFPFHRELMQRILDRNLERWEVVDHIDNNPLNNTRSNLRVATHSQNTMNSRVSTKNTSGYKGVSADSKGYGWRAQIKAEGTLKYLGTFKTPEEAHEAYKAAAVKYFGEFARFE